MPLGAKGCSPDVTLLDAGGQTGLLGLYKVRKGWQGLVMRYKSCHISLPKEDREYCDGFNWTPQFFLPHNGTIVVKLVLYQPHDKTLYEFKYTLGT
jgi:hypothetical protein